MKDKEEIIQPELKDMIENIQRYCAIHKNNVAFVASFIAFDEEKEERDEIDIIDDKGSRVFAYGDKVTLRILLEELRNTIEDDADDDDFINL